MRDAASILAQRRQENILKYGRGRLTGTRRYQPTIERLKAEAEARPRRWK